MTPDFQALKELVAARERARESLNHLEAECDRAACTAWGLVPMKTVVFDMRGREWLFVAIRVHDTNVENRPWINARPIVAGGAIGKRVAPISVWRTRKDEQR